MDIQKKIDIIFVTYNSEKWVKTCFESFLAQSYPLELIHIFVVDNASTDQTVQRLREFKSEHQDRFGAFKIIRSKKNLGFGRGNNLGFLHGTSETCCFFNVDTKLLPDTLIQLMREVDRSDEKTAMWELRQFPYEHPKNYDPVSMETPWSSGAAFAIRRKVFSKLKGFDKEIFMYAEDVDLSWRLRSYGYKIHYVPKAVIMHYSYEDVKVVKPNQHVFGVMSNLFLRYRYGGLKEILRGHLKFWFLILCTPEAFPGSKDLLLKEYRNHFHKIPHFLNPRNRGWNRSFKAYFKNWDYSFNRDDGAYKNEEATSFPKVSVIVRTCGRPSVLRETLLSLRHQTWKNLEIVVVEDGQDVSRKMIEEEFPDRNIVYFATGEKVGRSKAGNMAIRKATGVYINFLDDDDLFYADHVEVLAKELSKTENKAAYSFAFETPIDVIRTDPYEYRIKGWKKTHTQEFNRAMLCHHNYIPIQCIMFEKELFEQYGGLDESLDALEDWDLWVRYSLHTDFTCVKKTTSIYRVPSSVIKNLKRQSVLDEALKTVRIKHKGYIQTASVYDFATSIEEMARIIRRR